MSESQNLPIIPKPASNKVNESKVPVPTPVAINEVNLTWAGKLFFASIAAYVASDITKAMKLPIKLRGKPDQIQAVVDAITASTSSRETSRILAIFES